MRFGVQIGVQIGPAMNFEASGEAVIVAPTPTHQATGTKAEGVGDVTVNWPAHEADDVALLFIESNGNEPALLGTPAGFAEVTGSPSFDHTGGDTTRLTVYWCRATSDAMASPVITDPGNHCEAVIITYRGCRTFDVPYSASAAGDTDGAAAAGVTIPGATTEAPNCRVVIAIANGGGWDASGYTNVNLTGIAERFDDYTGLGGAGGLSIADGEFEGPGAYGDTTATMGAVQICGMMSIALTGSSGGGEAVAEDALLSLGAPIIASRIWTTGLSDDGYFICQAYNLGSETPPEWFVFNLAAGTYEMYEGPAGIFANSNFQVSYGGPSGSTSTATGGNQVRASNGRIFFPLAGLNIAYYDPTDHEIHHISIDDPGNDHAAVFRLEFGNDGLLYGTTQADSGTSTRPVVFSLDPDTLATEVIGYVGNLPNDLLYGYYLAVEDSGSHVYVAVGQDPWNLWSVNTATGVSTELTPGGIAGPYTVIEFNRRPEGWTARFGNGTTTADYWVADGALYAGAPVHNPLDFAARDVTPDGPELLVNAEDVEFIQAPLGILEWRERGGPSYTEILFDPTKVSINLEALVELPDDDVLVVAQQYNGFARLDGTWTHLLAHIISQPVFAEQGEWFTGYPNGPLWHYDYEAAWGPGVNPELVGDFSGGGLLSNMKYGYFLQRCADNNRLYCVGRLERSGEGSGIAYYDITGETFDGHHDAPLEDFIPRGMLVMEGPNRVVFSGETYDASDADLLVYDYDLTQVDTLVIGLGENSGLLYKSPTEPTVMVGLNDTTIYRCDVVTGLITSVVLGAVGASTQHADGRILAVVGTGLYEYNPVTLVATERLANVGLEDTVTCLSWTDEIYLTAGHTLYKLV